jgi:hypothetical protein
VISVLTVSNMVVENTEHRIQKPEGIIREFREPTRIKIGRARWRHRASAMTASNSAAA